MKNIDVMFQQLNALIEAYADGNDDEAWWISETGASMVDYIDCPYCSGSDKCINEKEEILYNSYEWNENCDECKSKWLMSDFEMW